MSLHRLSSLLAPVALAAVLLAGCGSSKPAYCSKVSDLKKSVQALTSVTSVSALTSQLGTIESNAKDAVAAAKSDFPSETTAVKSSLDALQTTVKQLPQSPSAAQIATLAKQAGTALTSVQDLASATSSKCG